MSRNFFAMLSRMKYITRWALMRNTRQENICEHSQDVAVLAHALALYHDAPEILTGDMPTPVKYYNPAIREAYGLVEDVAADKLLTMLPEDMRPEYTPLLKQDGSWPEERRLVKAADKLSALIKCVEESGQGNREFISARRATEEAIRAMGIPAADCFLEEFLPAYELTLDEQG